MEETFKGDISLNPTAEVQTLKNPKTLNTAGKGNKKLKMQAKKNNEEVFNNSVKEFIVREAYKELRNRN